MNLFLELFLRCLRYSLGRVEIAEIIVPALYEAVAGHAAKLVALFMGAAQYSLALFSGFAGEGGRF
jgi:hypothetical protein